jgi:hypothetical protein
MIISKAEIDNWRERSKKGEVCGILDCPNEPLTKCNHCGNHYCAEHVGILKCSVAHPQVGEPLDTKG